MVICPHYLFVNEFSLQTNKQTNYIVLNGLTKNNAYDLESSIISSEAIARKTPLFKKHYYPWRLLYKGGCYHVLRSIRQIKNQREISIIETKLEQDHSLVQCIKYVAVITPGVLLC